MFCIWKAARQWPALDVKTNRTGVGSMHISRSGDSAELDLSSMGRKHSSGAARNRLQLPEHFEGTLHSGP